MGSASALRPKAVKAPGPFSLAGALTRENALPRGAVPPGKARPAWSNPSLLSAFMISSPKNKPCPPDWPPLGANRGIRKYANWSFARMNRSPCKKGHWREAPRSLRDCCASGVRALWVIGLFLPVAACGSINGLLGHGAGEIAAPAPQAQVTPPGRGEQIGSGPARVALIVPLTQASGPSVVGTSLRNAAELAYLEAGGNDVTLLVKDD